MRAVSLWQPWAAYVARGMKQYETRSWATNYRGPLAIHAAQRRMTGGERDLLAQYALPGEPALGAIVACAELRDCIRMTAPMIASQNARERALGDWYPGRWAWLLVDVFALEEPMPWRGAQGLWSLSAEHLAAWITGWRP